MAITLTSDGTFPPTTKLATKLVTYDGVTNSQAAPAPLAIVNGTTLENVTPTNPVPVSAETAEKAYLLSRVAGNVTLSGTTASELKPTPGATFAIFVDGVSIGRRNDGTSDAATVLEFLDGSSGTVKFRLPVGKYGSVPPMPILNVGENKPLWVRAMDSIGTIYVSFGGFTAKVT